MIPYSSTTAKAAVLELTPDKLSVIVPEMITGTILPLGGQSDEGFAETFTTGGVRSMFTGSVTSELMLPALSSARRPTECIPSPLTCVVAVLPATTVTGPPSIQYRSCSTPLPESVALKCTVTGLVLIQPFPFAEGVVVIDAIGGTRSTLTGEGKQHDTSVCGERNRHVASTHGIRGAGDGILQLRAIAEQAAHRNGGGVAHRTIV